MFHSNIQSMLSSSSYGIFIPHTKSRYYKIIINPTFTMVLQDVLWYTTLTMVLQCIMIYYIDFDITMYYDILHWLWY